MQADIAIASLVHVLALTTFVSGVLIQALPVPIRMKSLAPSLQWDAVLTEIAIGTVFTVSLLAEWVQSLLLESLSIQPSGNAYAIIVAQLVAIDAAILTLIAVVNATVVFTPLAELLARSLGSGAGWILHTLVLWSVLQIVISQISQLWLLFWTIGIAFFAIPFRLGKRLGAYIMSTSIVSAIALPLLPSFALWVETQIGYQNSLAQLQSFSTSVLQNPLNAVGILTLVPTIIGNLLTAVILALLVFPVSYLFMMSLVARSVASLIMGSSASSFTIGSHDFLR